MTCEQIWYGVATVQIGGWISLWSLLVRYKSWFIW